MIWRLRDRRSRRSVGGPDMMLPTPVLSCNWLSVINYVNTAEPHHGLLLISDINTNITPLARYSSYYFSGQGQTQDTRVLHIQSLVLVSHLKTRRIGKN